MNTPVAIMLIRMKPLAHWRALLRRQPAGSFRGEQLAALLRAAMTAQPNEGRAK